MSSAISAGTGSSSARKNASNASFSSFSDEASSISLCAASSKCCAVHCVNVEPFSETARSINARCSAVSRISKRDVLLPKCCSHIDSVRHFAIQNNCQVHNQIVSDWGIGLNALAGTGNLTEPKGSALYMAFRGICASITHQHISFSS